ncbi:MAG: redox-regulated ATPase YchF [Alphaproteobacteria bacterium RIFCSPLOWO2_01_FULL_45_8]|nr:MAG: redox-regulated ATPase YchF [Alphaproteobacteria bacterium GWB1_45_5]OFW76713.1 MAG: redox-regulated ATPase YchF [Alphaproteobacteria bacterium GWA1_45_9]OFW89794.1 MAG: redox-regulated ATPase YchF [Alphaproteobacteria bacterium RIFCSPHIGHO2_01_FULL_41_14]OFW95930.1 MAG: redox-regulated ATPase YchF [Alphaproteobacteria bacterium RIFCSPLOWO2_01_FULL_45_8]HCI48924.1 redox-regulated ATPase YchF [Holosporales bacterium]
MGFNCGIVGLPNVGKSTLFNALTSTAKAEAANYPFCTIEPNIGKVGVPDERLSKISVIAKSEAIIPTTLEFVDIAGLVRGASKGEGLGNQFLGHIRSVDAIIHVLRCFEDADITHVEHSIDPLRDKEIIDTELMLSDLASLTKRKEALSKKLKSQDKDAKEEDLICTKLLAALEDGRPARSVSLTSAESLIANGFGLITLKPVLYVCNVQESEASTGNDWTQKVAVMASQENASSVVISASIESEISTLGSREEKEMFLNELGLTQSGLDRVIEKGYGLLNLLTFFTCGPKETRAWTTFKGATAPEAAGCIHSDFERGFIRAETIAYADFINCKGEAGAKEAGKFRQEGKEYVVQDGDILHFRFNV